MCVCGGGRLIEQIQRPALLIRLISLLPEVNYHTHTSCCCSTYIIITVARMESEPELAIYGPPSPAPSSDRHGIASPPHPHQPLWVPPPHTHTALLVCQLFFLD